MNTNIENIIKKYIRKVILPHYGFEYDEVEIYFPPYAEVFKQDRVVIHFHVNPYKLIKSVYDISIFHNAFNDLYSDLRTLEVAFNIKASYDFGPDEQLEEKFKREYVPKFRKVLQENGIYDINIGFGWNHEYDSYEFVIEEEKTDDDIKKKILEIYEKFIKNSQIKIYFGLD